MKYIIAKLKTENNNWTGQFHMVYWTNNRVTHIQMWRHPPFISKQPRMTTQPLSHAPWWRWLLLFILFQTLKVHKTHHIILFSALSYNLWPCWQLLLMHWHILAFKNGLPPYHLLFTYRKCKTSQQSCDY